MAKEVIYAVLFDNDTFKIGTKKEIEDFMSIESLTENEIVYAVRGVEVRLEVKVTLLDKGEA